MYKRQLLSNLHPIQGDWVVQRIAADVDSLNPVTLESADGQVISGLVNEGMLQMNNFTLKLEPCLAESCEVSPDQMCIRDSIYRLYEIVGVYGQSMKQVIHEEFGDGIMSAIDFSIAIDRIPDPKGDRVQIVLNGKFLSPKVF